MLSQLAAGGTKDDLAEAGRKAAGHIGSMLLARLMEVQAQSSALESELKECQTKRHKAETEAKVLTERLDGIRQQAELLSRFDWVLTIFIALGGAAAGFGYSWPDLSISQRVVIGLIGLAFILLPGFFKSAGGARLPK